uniref:Predicted protein n=1 Tax=Hordeum vulgare subsp. vulgare TaxID=112509 RepID=F2D0H5_HORVV|nr:predicted protein [Hordeum vulgare subsp. vulgare]BAJ92246.1 predicted protein [Hordeum vulgare subsp. vulgare]
MLALFIVYHLCYVTMLYMHISYGTMQWIYVMELCYGYVL